MRFIPVSPVVDSGEVDAVLQEDRADRGQVVLGRHVQGSLANEAILGQSCTWYEYILDENPVRGSEQMSRALYLLYTRIMVNNGRLITAVWGTLDFLRIFLRQGVDFLK